ncbi:MAG TPA: hypothetical protein VH062_10235 [Polyangiaceae bacterium]|jgi:hypothetical protein|nr:hypothetical protein [Polyangiaceae bacterium]
MHQRVNIRATYPVGFGDQRSQELYESECEAARARAVRTGESFIVAPRQVVTTHDGRRLVGEMPIGVTDFVPLEGRSPHLQLSRLVDAGAVLEVYGTTGEPEPPRAA